MLKIIIIIKWNNIIHIFNLNFHLVIHLDFKFHGKHVYTNIEKKIFLIDFESEKETSM